MFSEGELVFVFAELIFGAFVFCGLEGCEVAFVVVETFVVLVDYVGCYVVEEVTLLVWYLRRYRSWETTRTVLG